MKACIIDTNDNMSNLEPEILKGTQFDSVSLSDIIFFLFFFSFCSVVESILRHF